MQKTLIVLAMLAASTAFSQNVTTANGSVSSSAMSTSAGGMFSASGSATNLSVATGGAVDSNLFNHGAFSAGSSAMSSGSTSTTAGGIGIGGASAMAVQRGTAMSDQTGVQTTFVPFHAPVVTGIANATSGAGVGTYSNAMVHNTGLAGSGSNANAGNVSLANVIPGVASTGGGASVHTNAGSTPGDFASAGGLLPFGAGAGSGGSAIIIRP